MRQEDWQAELEHAPGFGGVEEDMAVERQIVEDYASENNLDYEDAERQLAEAGEILCDGRREITDIYTKPGEPFDLILYADKEDLPVFMEAAERAIEEFEKRTVRRITFPNILNVNSFCRWAGAPWDPELNFYRIRERFMPKHPRYSIGTNCGGGEGFNIIFRYRLPEVEE